MAKNLVIVESPSKSKTIEKYLGKDYHVVSSKGHIRDLSTKGKYGLGVDVDNNFKPDYTYISGKKKMVKELNADVKKVDNVYLATDPDREGEAISWHLKECLDLKDKNYKRIVFNEITKNAVLDSFNNARDIDINLVNSQETRRILDRIIGFRLSKLMQAKTNGSSAGRVQSVALKLIVDKEREIEKFNSEEYWTIKAIFPDFEAELDNHLDKEIKINNEEEANKILKELTKDFNLVSVNEKEKTRNSHLPFITSTLQQDASNKLGMNAKKTMSIAQKLYEGVDLPGETVGLITYMRTDSTRLSNDFINDTYRFIKDKFGSEYVGRVKTSKKTDNVQDAHEAIRPTSIRRIPEEVKPYLTNDEYKLYRIIYYRALASLMKSARYMQTSIILSNNGYNFKANGSVITFDGYLKIYSDYEDVNSTVLPDLKNYKSKIIISENIEKTQHFTKPPSRYTEAKLIKEMEELGIGRPSTYAKIIDTIKERGYVNITEKKFVPTEIGIEITDKLQEFFSHLINVKYTASMESDLDKIALGQINYIDTLNKFYNDFEPYVENAFKKMPKKEVTETGELCPECNSPLVYRKGRFGQFIACSNYPKCKYVKAEEKQVEEICNCPNCDGKIIKKRSKKGRIFYGCSSYPECKNAYWDMPIDEKCPNCSSILLQKGKKIYCSSCDFIKD